MSVSVKNNNVEFAIKRFRTQVARDGILSKARERADGYKKPGVRLREEKKKNTINSRKNSKKNNRENY
ncbi:MAG: 30S ribosomal protein S21 [Bacilli bacterium]|jgi:ribosomal protein S21|nr:30S ribosomal protein S21 [Clostridium sp.]MDY3797777.1 30S ribosomal protein S21 [Bacilli bacterium]CDE95684.1 unknown [Clostridium sp. CAG:914]